MNSMAFSLQFILEIVEPSSVCKTHIGVLAANPLHRSEREGIRGRGDPRLVSVAENSSLAGVGGGNDYVSAVVVTDREGPLAYRKDK